MKNKFIKYIAVAAVAIGISACSDDDSIRSESVFDTETPELTDLDQWIRQEYTNPYNIEVIYKWSEFEFAIERYLYPATLENVKPTLEVVKKIWIDSYTQVGGDDFVKISAPRQLALSGGFNSNPEGTITLGFAEGGKKIVLFNVDFIDFTDRDNIQQFLNTIQHEYTHILNQTVPFDEQTYGEITPTDYNPNWYESTDAAANEKGFVTAYASSAIVEDFAEMVATFLRYDNQGWNDFIDNINNVQARRDIRTKEAMMAEYFNSAFNIDIYELQEVVQQHTDEVVN